MRVAFTTTLTTYAKTHPEIMLLTADLGFSIFEDFIRDLPEQYLNAGISEQNMTGLAAGLAMEGKTPVIYSIIPFITMRNFEQIRNDICYQNQNVKIVGVGSGFSYGTYGHTHHGLEDIALMRSLANMTILSPSDPVEVKSATLWALQNKGPVYLRLGKAGEPILHKTTGNIQFGKASLLKKGSDATIFTTGAIANIALEIANLLERKNISIRIYSIHTIKPLDSKTILLAAKETHNIFSLEEHSIIGGLGSAISEVIAENSTGVTFKRFGVPDKFTTKIGMQAFMRKVNGLDASTIANKISELIS